MRAPRPLTQSGLIVLPVAIQPIRPKPVERRGSTGSPRTGFNEQGKLIPPVRPEPVEGQARPARDSTGAPCAKTSSRTGQNGRIQYPLQNGFTLVELAVVMVILGLLLGGLMLPLAAQREIQQQRAAEAALREIREALL
ncbi:MAG: prepilin-type N-terminal cleavage/methylation domain-containing protein, partial [Zoogloeaceae bacterium]|nr:prepilin-type N-terminal cleavage/methylation domain-containing protein [Zoogloeaceae bacterium]